MTPQTAKNDPRRVVIKQMSILINEDNNTTEKYSYSLDSTELLEKLKNTPFVLRGNRTKKN